MPLIIYTLITRFLEPALILHMWFRVARQKEDPRRNGERFGKSSIPRPQGLVLWYHAASLGETISIWPLILKMRKQFPEAHVLLTTGTLSSAELVARYQVENGDWLIHQFRPIDHPRFTKRFIDHWRPDAIFFVESELWPNLLRAARKTQAFMSLVNARLSQTSHRRWSKLRGTFQQLMSYFDVIIAQDDHTRDRINDLGVSHVEMLGNLKRDMAPLACNHGKLQKLKKAIGDRPRWLAAITHDDEENVIIATHRTLVQKYPTLLTIIVPRHPERTDDIIRDLTENVARASLNQTPDATTAFYMGDTIGDMGLYYRLSSISFIGGSLIPHGGQNPLEAARLDNIIVHGPSTSNFTEIYETLHAHKGCLAVTRSSLTKTIKSLLSNTEKAEMYRKGAKNFSNAESGATKRVLKFLTVEINNKISASQRGQ